MTSQKWKNKTNKHIDKYIENKDDGILVNRKNESVNCGNNDKIHIVYNKEEEAYSIYKFIEYVERDDHGLSEGDEETSVESNEGLNHSKWTQEQGIDWAIDPDSIRTHHGQNGVVLHSDHPEFCSQSPHGYWPDRTA